MELCIQVLLDSNIRKKTAKTLDDKKYLMINNMKIIL